MHVNVFAARLGKRRPQLRVTQRSEQAEDSGENVDDEHQHGRAELAEHDAGYNENPPADHRPGHHRRGAVDAQPFDEFVPLFHRLPSAPKGRPNSAQANGRVNEAVPPGFAKALKGRNRFTERASYPCSRKAYFALSGLNPSRRADTRTQAVGLGCAGAAPLGLSALRPPVQRKLWDIPSPSGDGCWFVGGSSL